MPAENPVDPIPALVNQKMIRRHFLPVAERTFFRMVSAGQFPPADMSLSGKMKFWRRSTIEKWIDDRAAEGGGR